MVIKEELEKLRKEQEQLEREIEMKNDKKENEMRSLQKTEQRLIQFEGKNSKIAKKIYEDVVKTRKPADHHKFLSKLSMVLDSSVYDDSSVMAVDKQTGRMRYNSCVKFDLNNVNMDLKTGKYNTRELDNILKEKPDSIYYYVWGELQNRD